jgi:Ankyrin repeat
MEDAGSIPAGLPPQSGQGGAPKVFAALRDDLTQWARIRRLTTDQAMIAEAAAARAAGDWRRAAAVARSDVDIDLDAVRATFGTEQADRIEDDLHHLALDLVWWHLPRNFAGMITVLPRVSAVLAPREGAAEAPLMRVRLPIAPFSPQRLQVSIATAVDLEDERWFFMPRHTWDVRETPGLREAWGVGSGLTAAVCDLLAAGRDADAWRACGIEVPFDDPKSLRLRPTMPTFPVGLAGLARQAAAAFGVDNVATLGNAYVNFAVGKIITAMESDRSEWYEVAPRIVASPVPADLALLESGRMSAADLHPLVRAAILPDRDEPVPRHHKPAARSVRVRCQGVWHEVGVAGGALRIAAHDADEIAREQVMKSLGGTSSGCFAARDVWYSGNGRLPRGLVEQRREVFDRLAAADTGWVLDGLAAGVIDPRMRDSTGATLLHAAMRADFARLAPLLLEAGIAVDEPDRIGRTPLYQAVMAGAPADVIQQLLAWGADPRRETVHEADVFTAAHRGEPWAANLLHRKPKSSGM